MCVLYIYSNLCRFCNSNFTYFASLRTNFYHTSLAVICAINILMNKSIFLRTSTAKKDVDKLLQRAKSLKQVGCLNIKC